MSIRPFYFILSNSDFKVSFSTCTLKSELCYELQPHSYLVNIPFHLISLLRMLRPIITALFHSLAFLGSKYLINLV